ncbi:MAG: accessory Sec system translocase SecA2 [Planctomycetota bacterium]
MLKCLTKLTELFHQLRGRALEIDLSRYEGSVAAIEGLAPDLEQLDEPGLRHRAAVLGQRARNGAPLDSLLVESYAVTREAARRVLGLNAFSVQLVAAVALHHGRVVEMQTGEGKTLAAVFAVALNALDGRSVHVLTFNDYLAQRDAAWMGGVYRLLGLSVDCIQEGMSQARRRQAYLADVTYATAKEAGFDYLRDRLAREREDLVQRPFHYAIVDEADSILVDEARNPLVIAGSVPSTADIEVRMADLVRALTPHRDFARDANSRNVFLTDRGVDRVESLLGCGNLYDVNNLPLLRGLEHALHAEVLLHRDVDYIVRNGAIELVDERTGRVAEKRRWPDGLHGAVAAKEGLELPREGTILGSITLRHFLNLYPKLAGMTGTARLAAAELAEMYGLRVAVVPTNRASLRIDHPDVVFADKRSKEDVLAAEIARVHATGRPVLVGTASVAESERLANQLAQQAVPVAVLNAKSDADEARIVADAGSLHAVTISTNMAGRGTDIRLGGSDGRERERVVALGGLYVIGTNRHDSRRIDNQLRGRAGRQGDPGASRFFVSLEDDLIDRYGLKDVVPALRQLHAGCEPISSAVVTREMSRAQRIVDSQNFEIRRTLERYSAVLETQRKVIHRRRDDVLLARTPLTLLASRAAERYTALRARFTAELLGEVERKLTLHHIDRRWIEHLALVDHLRAGIHLISAGDRNPIDVFHEEMVRAFLKLNDAIDAAIVASFLAAEITERGIDMEREGLTAPSATWNYLVNDHPFGTPFDRLLNGVVRLLKGRFGWRSKDASPESSAAILPGANLGDQ